MIEIYDFFGNVTEAPNAQVTWLSNFAENNLDWKKLKYKQYNDFLKALHNSSSVSEIFKQHHSA